MGEVWAARDLRAMGLRIVALKKTKQDGQEAAKVLFDEARIASLIEHPNVCKVHELGRAEGVQYMVMDWCDGASLFDLLQSQSSRSIPIPLAVKIVADAAAGLHAAHELVDESGHSLHVVHRDVSPQNVLISTTGVVTISDFGVAKARGQVHQATQTGEVKGKLSYMAPEQVRSKDIDRRADVFALGCVLYLSTLGQRPFAGGDAVALMYKILEADIEPPSRHDPAYPPSLETLVMRALAKSPDDRFQSAHELQVALERWLRDEKCRVTSQDIAALVEASVGSTVRTRNERIRSLAQGGPDPGTEEAVEAQASSEHDTRVDTVATRTILEGSFDSTVPRARHRWLAGAGVALVGAAVVLSFSSVFSTRNPLPATGASAALSAASKAQEDNPLSIEPSVVAEEKVQLAVHVSPPEATISLDGLALGRGTVELERPPTPTPLLLKIEHPGYQTVERSVRLDRTQSIDVTLVAELKSTETKTTKTTPRPVSTSTKPGPSTPPPAALPLTEPKPSPDRKPRTLDTTNPFAPKSTP